MQILDLESWRTRELTIEDLKNGDCKVIYYFHSFTILICAIIYFYLKNSKTYPCIGFFRKLPYPRIRILPMPIRVSGSVLHRLRYNAEKGWLNLIDDPNLSAFIFRLGGIYGPGRRFWPAEISFHFTILISTNSVWPKMEHLLACWLVALCKAYENWNISIMPGQIIE